MTSFEDIDIGAMIPIFLIAGVLTSLIPAAIQKMLMSGIFRIRVSYWLLLAVSAMTVVLTMLALVWLGLMDDIARESVDPVPALGLSVAAFLFQLALLTMFVPDVEVQPVAMWKWGIVVLLSSVVLFLIGFVIALFLAAAATNTV